MNNKHNLPVVKTVAFSTVAIIAFSVLKADNYPNRIAIPVAIGIATVSLAVSEQQGGIE
jgi:hypothetical protein